MNMKKYKKFIFVGFLFSSSVFAVNTQNSDNYDGPSVWPSVVGTPNKTKEEKLTTITANIEMKINNEKYIIQWNGIPVIAMIPDHLFVEKINASTTVNAKIYDRFSPFLMSAI